MDAISSPPPHSISLGGLRTSAPVRAAPPSWGRHPKTFTEAAVRQMSALGSKAHKCAAAPSKRHHAVLACNTRQRPENYLPAAPRTLLQQNLAKNRHRPISTSSRDDLHSPCFVSVSVPKSSQEVNFQSLSSIWGRARANVLDRVSPAGSVGQHLLKGLSASTSLTLLEVPLVRSRAFEVEGRPLHL